MKIHNRFLIVLALSSSVFATACSGRSLEGGVLDATTNKPVPDAIVVGLWQKDYLHGSDCIHVETHTTDDQGRFRLPHYWGDGPYHIYVYARNFEYVRPNGPVDDRQQLMKPVVGSNTERLEHLSWLNRVATCGSNAGRSKNNLVPLKRAVYEEARTLATTANDQKIVNNLLFSLEIVELGYEVAERRSIDRSRAKREG